MIYIHVGVVGVVVAVVVEAAAVLVDEHEATPSPVSAITGRVVYLSCLMQLSTFQYLTTLCIFHISLLHVF